MHCVCHFLFSSLSGKFHMNAFESECVTHCSCTWKGLTEYLAKEAKGGRRKERKGQAGGETWRSRAPWTPRAFPSGEGPRETGTGGRETYTVVSR